MGAYAWLWPPSGAAARGATLVPYGNGGIFVPDWRNTLLWPFFQSASGSVPVSGGNNSLSLGIVAATPDTLTGIYALGWAGTLWHVTTSGYAVAAAALPTGLYGGVATVSGQPYALATTSGSVYTSGGTLVGTFGTPTRSLQTSGTTLFSLNSNNDLIVTMQTPGGATGTISMAPGISKPYALLAASGGTLLVAGHQAAASLAGAVAFDLDPITQTQVLGVASGSATIWSQTVTGTDQWSFSQSVTGLANLSAVNWVPNGTQAIATGGGEVQILQYIISVLSLAQTLTLTNAGNVAVFATSNDALVCRPASNRVTPLTAYLGTWSVSGGAGLILTSPTAISRTGLLSASVGFASGVATLSQINGTWRITATGALNFAPTVSTVDAQGFVYFAGSQSGSGVFAVCSGVSVIGSGVIASGVPTSMVVDQGRWTMAIPAVSGLVVYSRNGPVTWAQSSSLATASGTPAGLCIAGQTLFAGVPTETDLFNFLGAPIYQPVKVFRGTAGSYNGSSWVTGALGVGNQPSALGVDSSGNILVACTNNQLFTLSTASGTVLASGAIPQYPGQVQSTPMGLSALFLNSGLLFASTVMAGDLIASNSDFYDNGGVLVLFGAGGYPTGVTGLSAGAVWSNSLLVSVVSGVVPDPTAPPVYFGGISAAGLLALGGGNLPLANPDNPAQLWDNAGVVSIS